MYHVRTCYEKYRHEVTGLKRTSWPEYLDLVVPGKSDHWANCRIRIFVFIKRYPNLLFLRKSIAPSTLLQYMTHLDRLFSDHAEHWSIPVFDKIQIEGPHPTKDTYVSLGGTFMVEVNKPSAADIDAFDQAMIPGREDFKELLKGKRVECITQETFTRVFEEEDPIGHAMAAMNSMDQWQSVQNQADAEMPQAPPVIDFNKITGVGINGPDLTELLKNHSIDDHSPQV